LVLRVTRKEQRGAGPDGCQSASKQSFFEKKDKKLLLIIGLDTPKAFEQRQDAKVFWSFFSKKDCFLVSNQHPAHRKNQ
jgi:hypothetical protein